MLAYISKNVKKLFMEKNVLFTFNIRIKKHTKWLISKILLGIFIIHFKYKDKKNVWGLISKILLGYNSFISNVARPRVLSVVIFACWFDWFLRVAT
jgi:hypothetical protein